MPQIPFEFRTMAETPSASVISSLKVAGWRFTATSAPASEPWFRADLPLPGDTSCRRWKGSSAAPGVDHVRHRRGRTIDGTEALAARI